MESRSSGSVTLLFSIRGRFALSSLFLAVALIVGGCQKASPDDRIAARSDQQFDEWITEHTPVLSPGEVRELKDARQQLKFRAMQSKTGQPANELAKAVYDDINGKTVRELLLMSYALQVDRVSTELANFQPQLKRFETHDTNRSLTDEEKAYVEKSLATLREKMQTRETELVRLKARLAELKQSSPAAAK